MRFYYGDNNLLRVLDEVEFWKRQEAEHTVVIEQIIPNLEPENISRLKEFRLMFNQTEAEVVKLMETYIRSQGLLHPDFSYQVLNFIYHSINESQDFIAFLNEMKQNSLALQNNIVGVTVINHIIRESEYFIGISQTVLYRT